MTRDVAGGYFQLTKPGITLFIGITAAAGYVTALGGLEMPARFASALVATMLMSGGAATLNQVAELKWDALMRRTSRRPLPSGLISERSARVYGWTLSVIGFTLALALLPWAAACYLVICHVSYVNIYMPLKRRTPLCTLTGAVPGAAPVLAGWAATGESVGVAAFALTGVVFMWQIPHFLAIGWMARDDYSSAGCPMLGVVEGTGRASARVSLAYSFAMLVCAVVVGLTSPAGSLYMNVALIACAGYVVFAWHFVRERGRVPARRLFFSSLVVLPVLLTALIADLVLL